MELFPNDVLRVFGHGGSFEIAKHHAQVANADADSPGDTTTVSTGNGTVVTHHRSSHSSGDVDGTVVPIVAIVFVFLWLIVKALMAPFTQSKNARRGQTLGQIPPTGGLTDEEQAILEKLQRTIGQMERRIESLETILIDEHRPKEKYGSKL